MNEKMEKKRPVLILALIMILFVMLNSLFSYSATDNKIDTADGIHVISPTSLVSVGDLSFYTCGDDMDYNSLYCEDTKQLIDINSTRFGNCILSYYDLNDIDCSTLKLIGVSSNKTYEKELSLTKTFVDTSIVTRYKKSDNGFDDAADTAIAIWFMSNLKGYNDSIDDALDWLKDNRNNDYKCWPKSSCDLFTTAKTAAYLNLADLDKSTKVVYDSIAWLEDKQNYIKNSDWYIHVTTTDTSDVNCTITIGGTGTTDTINYTSPYNSTFTASYGEEINVSCGETVTLTIKNHYNETVYSKKSSSDIIYQIPPGACWSDPQWSGCDIETTIYGAMAGIDSTRKALAKSYLSSNMREDNIIGELMPVSDYIMYSAIYYRYLNQDENIIKYLVFKQNNDGSWGQSNNDKQKLITLHVYKTLLNASSYSYTKEPIEDAKKWISENVPPSGLSSVEENALLFLLMRDTKSTLIKTMPILVNLTSDQTTIKLENPILTNLTNISYSSDKNYTSIALPQNLAEYERYNATITKEKKDAGKYFDIITITARNNRTNKTEIGAKIPIVLTTEPQLKISIDPNVDFLGSSSELNMKVSSNGKFKCSFSSDSDILKFKDKEINIEPSTEEIKPTFTTDEALRRIINTTLMIGCVLENEYMDYEKNFTFPVSLEQYPSKVINIEPEEIYVTGSENAALGIQNLIGETVQVELKFKDDGDGYFDSPYSIEIPPYKTKRIWIVNKVPKSINISSENAIIITAKSQEEEIPFTVEIMHKPFTQSIIWKLVVYAIVFVIVLLAIYYIYIYSDYIAYYSRYYYNKITKREQKETKTVEKKRTIKETLNGLYMKIAAKLPPNIKKMLKIEEKKEVIEKKHGMNKTGMEELIKMMKEFGKKDKEIIEELSKEGITEEEIKLALKNVKEEMDKEMEMKKEEDVVNVIKTIEKGGDTFKQALKKQGFTDEQIAETLEELDEIAEEKEKEAENKMNEIKGDNE